MSLALSNHMIRQLSCATLVACAAAAPAMAPLQSPRDMLIYASFSDHNRADAMTRIAASLTATQATLARSPGDQEAALMRGMALGYRGKLTKNRGDAVAARKQFEALIARDPHNAEAQLALGAWHMGSVNTLGRLVAAAAVGAHKPAGLAALDRAVAYGGNHALYPGLSALLRLQMDPTDQTAVGLAQIASHAATSNSEDRQMQRSATLILTQIRAGHTAETRALAARLLPFGWLDAG